MLRDLALLSLLTLPASCRAPEEGGLLAARAPDEGARQREDAEAVPRRVPDLRLELCVREDGTATPTWTEGIAVAIGREAAQACEGEQLPVTSEADAWLEVLEAALPRVAAQASELAAPFGIEPFDAVVAAGNRCSSDGFGWVPDHIGINLEAFHRSYGAPGEGAVERMRRIVAHEYVHLLTYACYPDHHEHRDTPWNRALWTMFFEGIGDYFSVSARWLPDERGDPSPVAAETLRRLEPILVERLEAFVDATPEVEEELRRGISMGRFDEKWGSLPVALWLHAEARARGEAETLAWMVRVGPDGVLPLALRHAAPEHRPRLRALAEHAREPR